MNKATEDADILARASLPLRACLLKEAEALTVGDRNRTYGDPFENMQHIANIFNAWTGRDITAREVAQLHTATKMARSQATADHRDSYVDSMAYRGIELECVLAQGALKS
jgi:hypothetical protein